MLNRRDFVRRGAQAALVSLAAPSVARAFPAPLAAPWGAPDRMAWWREARFGMFVHFGLYSVLAGEWNGRTDYGEWIRNNARIALEQYNTMLSRFNPTAFDADRMAALAAAAGMKYLVITTKHHDGFALWPSKQGDFNVARTPYRRDLMRLVADACRRHGVVPCWYHSIMDWHHPDYLPRRDWEKGARTADGASFDRYVQFLHAQVEELLTWYGDIGVMWFDGEWEGETWTYARGEALAAHVQRLSPRTLINSRVVGQEANGLEAKLSRPKLGDFGTPEQKVPDRGLPGVDWESCITMNNNWGYNRADDHWKSVPALVGLLTETASKGGNLLLNVGPQGDGAIPEASVERLHGLARWMKSHGDAIHGTEASPFDGLPFRVTRTARRINCFLPEWPTSRELLLPGLRTAPQRARMLGEVTRESLPTRSVDQGMVITLPDRASDAVCSVLALEFRQPPVITGA
ncbi:MAG: alpha-L-fucosidase [Gemmatimonadetes bacterium]|nr:alpha-L-fucosidase [Gemmatimonadota bacterium]